MNYHKYLTKKPVVNKPVDNEDAELAELENMMA